MSEQTGRNFVRDAMGTSFGMGQWLIWGAIALTALLVLFGMSFWLGSNRKKTIIGDTVDRETLDMLDNTAGSTKTTINDVKNAMNKTSSATSGTMETLGITGKVEIMSEKSTQAGLNTYILDATDDEAKSHGWGIWPWALISLLLMAALAWLVWTTWGLSGMSAIKWIFASLLALGALFATMGLFLMVRRHPLVDEKRGSPRGLGFLTMITGLVLAGASWFVWQPKIASLGNMSDQVSSYETDISNYKSQITGYEGRISGFESKETTLSAENTRLAGVISGLKQKLNLNMADADEISRLTAVVKGLNSKAENLEDDNKRLKGLIGTSGANGDEIARLKGVIAGLNSDVSGLDKNVSGLNKDVATKDTEIIRLKGLLSANGSSQNDEVIRLSGLVSTLTTDKTNLLTENKRMNSLIGNYKNDSEVQNAKIASLEADNAKIAGLEAEIETLRNKPPVIKTVTKTVTVPAPVVASATGGPVTALQLLREHGKKGPYLNLVNPDYKMTKIRTQGLINGTTGKFYRIALKSPGGKGYKFASGKYNQITPSAPFKASLDRVIEDIRTSLDGRRTYQIYTRGKASAGYFRGRMDKANPYNKITVLPRGANGKYGNKTLIRKYDNKLSNDELPNLRGAYLQEYIATNYEGINPIILDGKVSKSKNISKQSVDIILYVEE